MQLTCAISGESLAYRFLGDPDGDTSFVSIAGTWKKRKTLIQEQSLEDDQGWVWLPLIQISFLPFHVNYTRNSVTQPSLHHLTGGSVDGATEYRYPLCSRLFLGPDYPHQSSRSIFYYFAISKIEPVPNQNSIANGAASGASPCDQQ